MVLIADSGSTKTDWALIDISSNDVICFATDGMNPYSGFDAKSINEQISSSISTNQISKVKSIYFYGSGCVNEDSKTQVQEKLLAWFPNSSCNMKDDLYGAAVAMSGGQPCHIGILGTGSIAAYFDGQSIVQKSTSLGFLISNEGGGADIGAQVIKALVNKALPSDIDKAYDDYPKTQDDILELIYKADNPSQLIAGYSKPLIQFVDSPEVINIISNCFEKYYTWHLSQIIKDVSIPVHFIGSIAFHYSEILKAVLNKHQLILGDVEKKPLQKLISFHQSQQKYE